VSCLPERKEKKTKEKKVLRKQSLTPGEEKFEQMEVEKHFGQQAKKKETSLLRHLELTKDHPPIHGMRWSGIDCTAQIRSSPWLEQQITYVIENEVKPKEEALKDYLSGEGKAKYLNFGAKEVVNPFISYTPELIESHGVSVVSIDVERLAQALRNLPEDGKWEKSITSAHVHALERLRLVIAIPQGEDYKI